MSRAEAIRESLKCPKCGRTGVVHAERDHDNPNVALRLICVGEDGLEACGVLGTFVPPDPVAWSFISSPGEAAPRIQTFLNTLRVPNDETDAVDVLAFAQRKNDRISELEREVRQMAQMVHQAYHCSEADPCDCAWEECPRGVCQRAKHVLGIVRSDA